MAYDAQYQRNHTTRYPLLITYILKWVSQVFTLKNRLPESKGKGDRRYSVVGLLNRFKSPEGSGGGQTIGQTSVARGVIYDLGMTNTPTGCDGEVQGNRTLQIRVVLDKRKTGADQMEILTDAFSNSGLRTFRRADIRGNILQKVQ